jgi:hypothetical protein
MGFIKESWIIQSNDGRRAWETYVKAEAQFYLWLSQEFCEYNVYAARGNGVPLSFI